VHFPCGARPWLRVRVRVRVRACEHVHACAQLRMRVYVRVRMHVRDCGCRCAFVFGWVAACAPHACVCTGECVPPIASQELAVSHGTSARPHERASPPTWCGLIDNRGAASIEASDPTQACLCAASGMGVRTHLTHSCGRRFCGTAITRSATMHAVRLLRSSLIQLPCSPCAGHIRHGSGCCSAWRTASSFMRQIVHLVCALG